MDTAPRSCRLIGAGASWRQCGVAGGPRRCKRGGTRMAPVIAPADAATRPGHRGATVALQLADGKLSWCGVGVLAKSEAVRDEALRSAAAMRPRIPGTGPSTGRAPASSKRSARRGSRHPLGDAVLPVTVILCSAPRSHALVPRRRAAAPSGARAARRPRVHLTNMKAEPSHW